MQNVAEEFDIIGKRVPRIESVPKVTGAIRYIADMVLPGMLHGKFLRSPCAHARVVSIDTSKAEKLPGVKLILTPDDIIGKTRPVGIFPPQNLYALHQEVRYVGDEVAAVAAVDEETAEEALALLKVEYEELPAVFDPEEAMRPGAPQLHEEAKNIRDIKRVRVGNIEEGFRQANHIFKARFQTSKQAHVCLETHGCLSSYEPTTGKLTHWVPSQMIFFNRLDLARALNMPLNKVRVIAPDGIGGAFGSKCTTASHDICAALMSRRLGRPVKFILSREEEFLATISRHPFIRDAEIGLTKDGTIVAWRERTIQDIGAYADIGQWTGVVTLASTPGTYKIPNVWADNYLVYTDKSNSGAYRGFGNPQATFARESLLDIAAGQMGMDPLELRLKNIIKPADLPYTTSNGLIVRSCGMEECLKKAAEAIGWGSKRKANTGVGLSCTINWGGDKGGDKNLFDACFGSALVEIAVDGSVTVRTGNSDIGQGLYTTLAQIAAEELGIPLDRVTVVGADSDTTPPDMGCYASRSALVTGSAMKRAASEAKETLLKVASKMLEVDPEDLMAKRGKIQVKDLSKSLPIEEVARAAYFTNMGGDAGPIIGRGVWTSQTVPQNADGYGNFVPAYAFAAHAAEVEVDPATGTVRITRYVTAHDTGRVINVHAVEGQIHGATGQGIGYGMLEEGLTYDSQDGHLRTPSIMEYKLPTAADLPDMQTFIVEAIDPDIPLGNKGVGEPGIICPAAAIANAIYDAVGVRIKDLPITPVKIMRALQEKHDAVKAK
ncbi:MAG: xanthine dehydrogenase family protein molybdopterin-binding subunit [Chloroflexi bacterium]|nr:xanthine dehydrogenase family protein molybdopterin-binding subunit [Chloroflexota bacterium]